MKVAPVSADLLVKLAGLAVLVLGAVYVMRRVAGAGAEALDAAGNALQYINPASDQNVIYQTANLAAESISGQPGQTIGGLAYDANQQSLQTLNQYFAMPAASTGGATGSW